MAIKKTAFDNICHNQSPVVISKILLIANDESLTEIFKTTKHSKILEGLKILLIDQQQWQDNTLQLTKIVEHIVKTYPELLDSLMDKYLDNQYPKQDSAIKILKNNLIYVDFLKYSDQKVEKLLKELIGKDISLELVNKKLSHTAENTLLRKMAWRNSNGLGFILENVTDKKGLYLALTEVSVGQTVLKTAKNTATRLNDTETPKILRPYEIFYKFETKYIDDWTKHYTADFNAELVWDDMTFLGHAVRYGYTDLATKLMENEHSQIILSKENIKPMVAALTKNKEAFCLAALEHLGLADALTYADLDAFKPLYEMAKSWKYLELKREIEEHLEPPTKEEEQQQQQEQQEQQQQSQSTNSVAKKFDWLDADTTTAAIHGTVSQVGFLGKLKTKLTATQTKIETMEDHHNNQL